MTLEELFTQKIILASQSPRRQALLKDLGLSFQVKIKPVQEEYPNHLQDEEIAIYLAKLKADAFSNSEIPSDSILVTADTIVCYNKEVLAKPTDYAHAVEILQKLSGNMHRVISGVCLRSHKKTKTFSAATNVFFKKLSMEEIRHYIKHYKPYDKAGAYGIQEWIGYIGIERIEGSFYNVMGLPVQRLYEELLKF